MSKLRIMFVGHGPSNLPEDRVVNTFHFTGSGSYAATVELALDNVESFYTDLQGGITSISYYLSAWVQRSAELRAYDLESAKPRIPTIRPITLPGTSGTGMPEEVAVCLSYLGAPPATRRRRGRIFFGPLSQGAVIPASSSQPARPEPAVIAALNSAATTLAAYGSLAQWCVRSTLPAENFVPITHGYVDNALDTQRRRGPVTTARTEWTTVGL